jgi:hypothetical protein
MTTAAEVIRAAMPGASTDICEYILWNRTPYPAGKVTAQSLCKAASRTKRAWDKHVRLCELCDRKVEGGRIICRKCEKALEEP